MAGLPPVREVGGPPEWWCPKGFNMGLATTGGRIIIAKDRNPDSAAAMVRIGVDIGGRRPKDFRVGWQLEHANGNVVGTIIMDADELRHAFGLMDGSSKSGVALASRCGFEADAAEQGLFFRIGRYLKLPHPGTSAQGDPNISLHLDDEIRAAVLRFVNG